MSLLKLIINANPNNEENEIGLILKEILTRVKQVSPFFGPLFLFTAVFKAFMYLPDLMDRSINQLESVEGILEKKNQLLRRPIEPGDIAREPGVTLYTENKWGREEMIAYIASIMEVPEGRKLFGKLVASEYRGLDGLRKQGPIISQDFAIAIQKKRKTIKEEVAKSVKEKLIEKVKSGDVPEETVKKLTELLSQLSQAS